MAIPLLGPRKSVSDATLDNSGDGRGLSGQRGCQTRGRRSPTGNQQWLAGARSRNFSRPDRSLCKRRERRDRAGRPCAYHQGTRSQPYQQAHLPQVGYVPAKGGQTVSCPRMAPKIAYGPKNQRPYSGSHVPPLREGHALGTDFPWNATRSGRTQRSQQATKSATYFDRGAVWVSAQPTGPPLSLYGPSRWVYGPSY